MAQYVAAHNILTTTPSEGPDDQVESSPGLRRSRSPTSRRTARHSPGKRHRNRLLRQRSLLGDRQQVRARHVHNHQQPSLVHRRRRRDVRGLLPPRRRPEHAGHAVRRHRRHQLRRPGTRRHQPRRDDARRESPPVHRHQHRQERQVPHHHRLRHRPGPRDAGQEHPVPVPRRRQLPALPPGQPVDGRRRRQRQRLVGRQRPAGERHRDALRRHGHHRRLRTARLHRLHRTRQRLQRRGQRLPGRPARRQEPDQPVRQHRRHRQRRPVWTDPGRLGHDVHRRARLRQHRRGSNIQRKRVAEQRLQHGRGKLPQWLELLRRQPETRAGQCFRRHATASRLLRRGDGAEDRRGQAAPRRERRGPGDAVGQLHQRRPAQRRLPPRLGP